MGRVYVSSLPYAAAVWSLRLRAGIWWCVVSFDGVLLRSPVVSLRGSWVYRLPRRVVQYSELYRVC